MARTRGARKAKLRLDLPAEAVKELASGDHAIVPGRPDKSELIARIFSSGSDAHAAAQEQPCAQRS